MSNQALKAAATGKQQAASRDQAKTFPAMIEMYKEQIKLALPKHMDANRMARVALTCYRMTPLLAKCDPASVFACIIQSSQLGLEPGINGEAYLVPFWNTKKSCYECQLIPGYRGLIKLARNTSQIESVAARIVYSNDQFDVVLGTEESITHRPMVTGERGEPVLAYCIAKFKDGGFHFEPMLWKEIMAIKARSKSRNKKGEIVGPWITDEEEMARKTVIRRASKYWPMSVELATAVALDNAAAAGIAQSLDTAAAIAGEAFVVHEEDEADAPALQEPEKAAASKGAPSSAEAKPEAPAAAGQQPEDWGAAYDSETARLAAEQAEDLAQGGADV